MTRRRAAIVALVASVAVLTLAFAGTADAIYVSGKQKVQNEKGTKFKMTGGLIGDWKVTSFKQIHDSPTFKGKGTEKFSGCVDRDGDGSCSGEPTGKMFFSFVFWAVFNDDGSEQLGNCMHPVTGGKGDFSRARGFLAMVDTPIAKPLGTKTHYEGIINLGGARSLSGAGGRSEAPRGC